MKPIIRVTGLSKQYRIGRREAPYATLRESLMNAATSPVRRMRRAFRQKSNSDGEHPNNQFWALKDIDFEVHPGEVVGIIGRNGAGKSTLLKVLSRVTEPTEGCVQLWGRIASLLEVGTGFHPELTGRENIYLNGAILGMTRWEINRKLDVIVDFSEIEKFLDTPVKRYSSGMYLKLAFAVAAHLEPEILVIDEVLAVGDAQFQKKCLGKVGDVARAGRTVLLVSHQLGSIANLCSRAMLLVQGTKRCDGSASEVIADYLTLDKENQGERSWPDPATAPGNDKVRLRAVRIVSGGDVTADVDIQNDVQVQVEFWNLKPGARLNTSVHLLDKMGQCILASGDLPSASLGINPWYGQPHPVGLFSATCTLPGNFLNEGLYHISAFVVADVNHIELQMPEVVSFTVHETGAMRAEYSGAWIGMVRPKLAWQTEFLGSTMPPSPEPCR